MKEHLYRIELTWTGNTGANTQGYSSYDRTYDVYSEGKYSAIKGSSDPAFRGEAMRYNPEELFLSSIASCHMLWYLHLCSVNSIEVVTYSDKPVGYMTEQSNGSGAFSKVILYPKISLKDAEGLDLAGQLHHKAHERCFIANSCNFPILHKPSISLH